MEPIQLQKLLKTRDYRYLTTLELNESLSPLDSEITVKLYNFTRILKGVWGPIINEVRLCFVGPKGKVGDQSGCIHVELHLTSTNTKNRYYQWHLRRGGSLFFIVHHLGIEGKDESRRKVLEYIKNKTLEDLGLDGSEPYLENTLAYYGGKRSDEL